MEQSFNTHEIIVLTSEEFQLVDNQEPKKVLFSFNKEQFKSICKLMGYKSKPKYTLEGERSLNSQCETLFAKICTSSEFKSYKGNGITTFETFETAVKSTFKLQFY